MWEKGGASENDMLLPTGLAFKSPTDSFDGASFSRLSRAIAGASFLGRVGHFFICAG